MAIAGMLLAAGAPTARAQTDFFWVGANNANWSAAASWSASSGGVGGAGVPGASDTVIFDGGVAGNATLDSAFAGAVSYVVVTAGFSGRTITQQSGADLVVGGNFELAEGAIWQYVAGTEASPTPSQLTVNGNMTVNGIVRCMRTSTADEGTGRHFVVGGNLIVGETGFFDAVDRGFASGAGPGGPTTAGNNHNGGSHAGLGGLMNTAPEYATETYGSLTAPVSLGSGGAGSGGGGAIRLTVGGAATNNGVISACAVDGAHGRGAGGSVFIRAGTLSGDGYIRANGGMATGNSGGGGGRISLVVTNNDADFASFEMDHVEARGGQGNTIMRIGGAGTIYLEAETQGTGNGTVVVDNRLLEHNGAPGLRGTVVPAGATWNIPTLILRGHGILSAGPNSVINLAADSMTVSTNAGNAIRLKGGHLVMNTGPLEVTNFTFFVETPSELTGDVIVRPGGLMTHLANASAELYKIDLKINGNLTVDADGAIDVVDKGYANRQGPGTNTHPDNHHRGGAHGGEGGNSDATYPTTPYGSLTAPTTIGSGGAGGRGAGAIILTVSDTVTNNGAISATASTDQYARGSGGSVFITAGRMAGSGTFSANGGDATSTSAGGGGRVALVVTNAAADFAEIELNKVTAKGGVRAESDSRNGGAGTVYLRTANQGLTEGLLIIDTDKLQTRRTRITDLVTDAAVGHVVIRGTASFSVDDGATLIVYGDWTNEATVQCDYYGNVEFAGPASATILGNNTWGSLTITNAGKTVSFGKDDTQTVIGELRLAGVDGNLMTLRSTDPGEEWFFTAKPGSLQVTVSYVDVSDSNAGDGDAVTATFSVGDDPAANNTNWIFSNPAAIKWTGGGGSSDWMAPGNWDLGRAPLVNDPSITIAQAAFQPRLGTARSFSGDLIIQENATLDMEGFNLTIAGDATVAGTLLLGGGNFSLAGNLTMSGALTASGWEILTLSSNADFNGGDFTAVLSTVVLNGTAAQTFDPDGLSFHYLLIENGSAPVTFTSGFTAEQFICRTAGAHLVFAAGNEYTVNDIHLLGADGAAVTLQSSIDDDAWLLTVANQHTVRYVDVRDSDASGGRTVQAINSTNTGNNSNWDFGAWHIWSGTSSDDFGVDANWAGGTAPATGSFVLIDGLGANAPVVRDEVEIGRLVVGLSEPTILTLRANLTVGGIATIDQYGILRHATDVTANLRFVSDLLVTGILECQRTSTSGEGTGRHVTIDGDVHIGTNGLISAIGMGFVGRTGPGTPPTDTNNHRGGAHGGEGGHADEINPTKTYGSLVAPVSLGSGGASSGAAGGAVRLTVVGNTINHGLISANGDWSQYARGAGGSVYLTTRTLSGQGYIRADAADRDDQPTGATSSGGGGRVALILVDPDADFSDFNIKHVTARGGDADSARRGGAGTVYLQTGRQASHYGALIVDNREINSNQRCIISDLVRDTTVGDVIIRNHARLHIDEEQSLTVQGNWTNEATVENDADGTVVFTGAAPATILGDNTWGNLTIATAGKTVAFEAGKTQILTGTPTFENVVWLLSTVPGLPWYLVKPGGAGDVQPVGAVVVQDSDASAGKTFVAGLGSASLGNNRNWRFPPRGSLLTVR